MRKPQLLAVALGSIRGLPQSLKWVVFFFFFFCSFVFLIFFFLHHKVIKLSFLLFA